MGNCKHCSKSLVNPLGGVADGNPRGIFVSFAETYGLFCDMGCVTAFGNSGRVVCEQVVVPRTAEPEVPEPSLDGASSGLFGKAYRAVHRLAMTMCRFSQIFP